MEQLQQGFSGIEKFYQIMDVEPKIVSKPKALKKSDFIGDIQFKNVEFSYSQDEHEFVLKNFSYEIPAGRKVAIVGETGVGKTTISKLLPAFMMF